MSMHPFIATSNDNLLDLAPAARIVCRSVLGVWYTVHIGIARWKLDNASFVGFLAQKGL